jgi:hypothetical protein
MMTFNFVPIWAMSEFTMKFNDLFDCPMWSIEALGVASMKQLSTTSKLESFHVSCDFDEATFRYLKISKLECRVQDIDWEPWVWMQLFKLGRKLEWRNILPWSDCYHFNTMIFHWEKSNELNWVMQHSWIFLKKLNTYNKVKQFTHKLVLSQKHSSNSINDL